MKITSLRAADSVRQTCLLQLILKARMHQTQRVRHQRYIAAVKMLGIHMVSKSSSHRTFG